MTDISTVLSNYMQRCHVSASPRAALLDMDGTLYDSMPHHVEAWLQVFNELGIALEPQEVLLAEGRTGADTVRQIFLGHRGQEVSDEYCRELYTRKAELFRRMDDVEVMPGAKRLVMALQRAGLTTVLVTGSGQNSLLGRLERDFPGAFPEHRRVTAYNVTHGKPSPEPFQKGMALAGVAPHEALAFDNAPLGVESASTAQAITIGVLTGPIPATALADAGADVVYGSMEDCAEAFITYLQE